jgi:hypothetical protein
MISSSKKVEVVKNNSESFRQRMTKTLSDIDRRQKNSKQKKELKSFQSLKRLTKAFRIFSLSLYIFSKCVLYVRIHVCDVLQLDKLFSPPMLHVFLASEQNILVLLNQKLATTTKCDFALSRLLMP